MTHMIENKLISNNQFGFMPGRSTSLQLQCFLDLLTKANDDNVQMSTIYLDFEKAFDKVPHHRLILKLRKLGLHEQIVSWVKDFLTDRKQSVSIGNTRSSQRQVLSGVPQGSVLGPVLFICYINDMEEHLSSKLFMFADDTKLCLRITSEDDHKILQQDLDKIWTWCNEWQLKLNITKCHLINFNRDTHNIALHLGPLRTTLPVVETEKDLGVTFDKFLSFRDHITTTVNKANSTLNLIRRSFNLKHVNIFKMIFISLVRSKLEYAASVWNPYQIGLIKQLESVQRRATKFILHLKHLPYGERLQQLDLHSLYYRRLRGDLIEVFKMIKNKYDRDCIPTITFRAQVRDRTTRQNELSIFKQRYNKEIRRNYLINRVTDTWNNLPNEIVHSDSVSIFKHKLDKHLSNLKYFYYE